MTDKTRLRSSRGPRFSRRPGILLGLAGLCGLVSGVAVASSSVVHDGCTSASACNHSNANFLGKTLTGNWSSADFTGANVRNVNFQGTDIRFAKLVNVDARGATFTNAHTSMGTVLDGGNFSGATFRKTTGSGHPIKSAINANLSNATLAGVRWQSANLQGANLNGATIETGTNLQRTNLHNAKLRGTDLRGAGLAQANLVTADLTNADLRGLRIAQANFGGATIASSTKLAGANLSDSIWVDGSRCGIGSISGCKDPMKLWALHDWEGIAGIAADDRRIWPGVVGTMEIHPYWVHGGGPDAYGTGAPQVRIVTKKKAKHQMYNTTHRQENTYVFAPQKISVTSLSAVNGVTLMCSDGSSCIRRICTDVDGTCGNATDTSSIELRFSDAATRQQVASLLTQRRAAGNLYAGTSSNLSRTAGANDLAGGWRWKYMAAALLEEIRGAASSNYAALAYGAGECWLTTHPNVWTNRIPLKKVTFSVQGNKVRAVCKSGNCIESPAPNGGWTKTSSHDVASALQPGAVTGLKNTFQALAEMCQ